MDPAVTHRKGIAACVVFPFHVYNKVLVYMPTVHLRDGFGNDMYLIGGPANDVELDVT
ncbi:MAG: hypothetical protein VX237_01925 [Chloroflexota bacterium]|nr:hypothetical protein [Chloroflexota bacterium]